MMADTKDRLAGADGRAGSLPFPAASRFVSLVSGFSLGTRIFSKPSCQKAAASFYAAGLRDEDAEKYLSGSLHLSLAFSLFVLLPSLLALEILDAVALSLLSLALSFAALYLLPSALAKRNTALAESELPFLLRELAVYLDIGLPFEKALAKIAARSYALSPDFSRCISEVKSGSTMQSALSSFSSRTHSLQIKRSLLLISSIYETGAGTEPLKRTAEEISATQLSSMRTQSSRLSLLAIIFIACSALIPSFFTVFAAVSPAIGASQVPEWQVWLAFIAVFPFLNIAALILMLFLLPPISRQFQHRGGLMDEYLQKRGVAFSARTAVFALALLSFLLAALFFVLNIPLLSILSLCLAPAAYAAISYFAGREIDEAEEHLPDALYSAASTHKLLSSDKMLSFLSSGGFGRLSESFALALRRQKAGDSFASSMAAGAAHCPSPLVSRSFSLIVVSYETGANMYAALREAASDVVSFFALVRERSAQTAMQRYTILAASSALVPAILGIVVSLSPALSGASMLSGQGGSSLLPTLSLACPVYLLLHSIFSSILLALSETNLKRAVLYFAFTAPLSQVIFSLAASNAFSFASY